MVNSMRLTLYLQMKKIMGSPLLFIVISFFYPTVYLLQINSHIYTVAQIIVTLIFVLLVAVVTALIAGISIRYFVRATLLVAKKLGLKIDIISVFSKLYCSVLGGIGTIILLVLLLSVFREIILQNALLVLVYLIIALGISFITYRFGVRFLNFSLCMLIVFNCALLVLDGFMGKSLNIDIPKMQQEVVFKQKPNVYFVVLESYASLDIRKEIYGIDNEPLIRELNEKNYDIYKTYANYGYTLSSLASTFLMDHHYYKLSVGLADGGGYRKIIGGVADNRVMNIFLSNGYRIEYNEFPTRLYLPSSVVRTQEIRPLLQPIELFSGLIVVLNSYYPWFTKFYQSLLWLPEKITGKLTRPAEDGHIKNDRTPLFSVIYSGAFHTPISFLNFPPEISRLPAADNMPLWQLNHLNNYWIAKYKSLVAKSDKALIEFVRGVTEKDPEAIVILCGDHGTYFNRNRWLGEKNDPNENMLENGIEPAEVTRDIFEIFMAIKWPSGAKTPHEYFSSVNLFRQVIAVLTEDPSINKTHVSNDSFIDITKNKKTSFIKNASIYRTVKDGKILDRWQPFTPPVTQ